MKRANRKNTMVTLLCISLLFAASNALASGGHDHRSMTADAIVGLDGARAVVVYNGKRYAFTNEAIAKLQDANLRADSKSEEEDKDGRGYVGEWYVPEAHCDNDTLTKCMSRLIKMKEAAVKQLLSPSASGKDALYSVGRATHAIQEYYSHSNWVDTKGMNQAKRNYAIGYTTMTEVDRSIATCTNDKEYTSIAKSRNVSGHYVYTDRQSLDQRPRDKCSHGQSGISGISKDGNGPGASRAKFQGMLSTRAFICQVALEVITSGKSADTIERALEAYTGTSLPEDTHELGYGCGLYSESNPQVVSTQERGEWTFVKNGWRSTTGFTRVGSSIFGIQNGSLYKVDSQRAYFEKLASGITNAKGMISHGALLYFVDGRNLYRFNPISQRKTRLGLANNWASTEAMTAQGDSLYIVQKGVLYRVSPYSGRFTAIISDWRGTAALTTLNGELYGVQGDKLWHTTTSGDYKQIGKKTFRNTKAMVGHQGRIYIAAENTLYEVDPHKGGFLRLNSDDWSSVQGITAIGNKLFVIDNGRMYRVNTGR